MCRSSQKLTSPWKSGCAFQLSRGCVASRTRKPSGRPSRCRGRQAVMRFPCHVSGCLHRVIPPDAPARALGQLHLALTLPKPRAVRLGVFPHAAMAGDTFLEFRPRPVLRRQRPPTRATQRKRQFAQAMAHRHPLVEDETSAAARGSDLRHLLQVFQDATLAGDTPPRHPAPSGKPWISRTGCRRCRTSRCACCGTGPGWPPTRRGNRGSFPSPDRRALECADGRLVVVPRVDHRHIRCRDQIIPVAGRHIGPDQAIGVRPRHPHRHDLRFSRTLIRPNGISAAVLSFHSRSAQPGSARTCARTASMPARPRDGAVDPLGRDQERCPSPRAPRTGFARARAAHRGRRTG
jgi:hypothetical protein